VACEGELQPHAAYGGTLARRLQQRGHGGRVASEGGAQRRHHRQRQHAAALHAAQHVSRLRHLHAKALAEQGRARNGAQPLDHDDGAPGGGAAGQALAVSAAAAGTGFRTCAGAGVIAVPRAAIADAVAAAVAAVAAAAGLALRLCSAPVVPWALAAQPVAHLARRRGQPAQVQRHRLRRLLQHAQQPPPRASLVARRAVEGAQGARAQQPAVPLQFGLRGGFRCLRFRRRRRPRRLHGRRVGRAAALQRASARCLLERLRHEW
jgi:hypothetical protein